MRLLLLSFVIAISASVSKCWWIFSSEPEVHPQEDVSEECLRQAAWGRCEFYECLERRFPCGAEEYATYIGHHFCSKIIRMFDSFTESGQHWMNGTSRCLTNSLLPIYNSDVTTCSAIQDAGANGLTSCNARVEPDGSDFCGFVRDNKEQYEEVFSTSDMGRMIGMNEPGVVMTLFVNGVDCGASRLGERMGAAFASVGHTFESWGQSIGRGWGNMVDWMSGN